MTRGMAMPVDPRIPLQTRVAQFDSPLETYGKVAAIKDLIGRGRLQDVAVRQAEQQMADQNVYRSASQEAGGDLQRLRDLLMARGQPMQAMAVDKAISEQRKAGREASAADLKLAMERLDFVGRTLGTAQSEEEYLNGLRAVAGQGIDVSAFPQQWSPEVSAQISQKALSTKDRLDQAWKQKQPLSSVAKLKADLEAGRITQEEYQHAYELATKGPKAPSVQISGPLLPGKEASNKVDTGLLESGGRMARLTRIEQAFKPEFLTIEKKAGATWASIKEKAGVGLDKKERSDLEAFSRFKQEALANLNDYIKEITGAALSEMEAKRIMAAAPNPGQGLFDGDSPTEFKAKLDNTMRQVRMAEARYAYIKRRGFSINDVPLESMPAIMRQRDQELEQEVSTRFPNMNKKERDNLIKQQLAREFGLVYE